MAIAPRWGGPGHPRIWAKAYPFQALTAATHDRPQRKPATSTRVAPEASTRGRHLAPFPTEHGARMPPAAVARARIAHGNAGPSHGKRSKGVSHRPLPPFHRQARLPRPFGWKSQAISTTAAASSISSKPVEPVSTANRRLRLMPRPHRATILILIMVYTLREGRSGLDACGAWSRNGRRRFP